MLSRRAVLAASVNGMTHARGHLLGSRSRPREKARIFPAPRSHGPVGLLLKRECADTDSQA